MFKSLFKINNIFFISLIFRVLSDNLFAMELQGREQKLVLPLVQLAAKKLLGDTPESVVECLKSLKTSNSDIYEETRDTIIRNAQFHINQVFSVPLESSLGTVLSNSYRESCESFVSVNIGFTQAIVVHGSVFEIWDITPGNEQIVKSVKIRYLAVGESVTCIFVNSDLSRFAFGSDDGRIIIYDVSGDDPHVVSFKPHDNRVNSISVNDDFTRCVSVSNDGAMKISELTPQGGRMVAAYFKASLVY